MQQYVFKNHAARTWQLRQSFLPRSDAQKWLIDLTLVVFSEGCEDCYEWLTLENTETPKV